MKISEYKTLKDKKDQQGEFCAVVEQHEDGYMLSYTKYNKNTGLQETKEQQIVDINSLLNRKAKLEDELEAVNLLIADCEKLTT